jgi:fumarate hydratase subunit alpha
LLNIIFKNDKKITLEEIKLRIIDVNEITETLKEMCIQVNHYLSDDMVTIINKAELTEKSPKGKQK